MLSYFSLLERPIPDALLFCPLRAADLGCSPICSFLLPLLEQPISDALLFFPLRAADLGCSPILPLSSSRSRMLFYFAPIKQPISDALLFCPYQTAELGCSSLILFHLIFEKTTQSPYKKVPRGSTCYIRQMKSPRNINQNALRSIRDLPKSLPPNRYCNLHGQGQKGTNNNWNPKHFGRKLEIF